jgi:hypothetical protein
VLAGAVRVFAVPLQRRCLQPAGLVPAVRTRLPARSHRGRLSQARPRSRHPRGGLALYAAIPTLALLYGRTLLDTLHERVGEEQHLRARGGASASPYNNGTWGRVIGQHGDRDGDSNGVLGSGPKFDFDFSLCRLGKTSTAHKPRAAGARTRGRYAAIGTARGDVTHFNGLVTTRAGHDDFTAFN